MISDKACYELDIRTYEELLSKKGISKVEFLSILEKYVDNTDNAVLKTQEYIEKHYSDKFKTRLELNKALKQIILDLPKNKITKMLEQKIVDYIFVNLESLPDTEEEIIELIQAALIEKKPLEMNDSEFKILILVTLKRFEEGFYEKSVS
ncbi:hypothetical protein HQN89_30875 [Paenibacillus frigoriresistens]|uniref:hypothetical protein n=1 Tax=Paenibacillus alginolyticus TaxID=59839 RepID=UPI0015649BA8|nr:hypothetical protein [Paenibacillus frigoriresistens]NRF95287.1 hypothetical protein [Paenibacillus frigoriresistens]